jgi:hypothetical protein
MQIPTELGTRTQEDMTRNPLEQGVTETTGWKPNVRTFGWLLLCAGSALIGFRYVYSRRSSQGSVSERIALRSTDAEEVDQHTPGMGEEEEEEEDSQGRTASLEEQAVLKLTNEEDEVPLFFCAPVGNNTSPPDADLVDGAAHTQEDEEQLAGGIIL